MGADTDALPRVAPDAPETATSQVERLLEATGDARRSGAPTADAVLKTSYDGAGRATAPDGEPGVEGAGNWLSLPAGLAREAASFEAPPASEPNAPREEDVSRSAARGLHRAGLALTAAVVSGAALSALAWSLLGLPLLAGLAVYLGALAAPALRASAARGLARISLAVGGRDAPPTAIAWAEGVLDPAAAAARRLGAGELFAESAPDAVALVKALSARAGVPPPRLFLVAPGRMRDAAQLLHFPGAVPALFLRADYLRDHRLDSLLAHEIQHAADLRLTPWLAFPSATLVSVLAGALASAVLGPASWAALAALPAALAALLALRLAQFALLELRGDLGSMRLAGHRGILELRGERLSRAWIWPLLRAALGPFALLDALAGRTRLGAPGVRRRFRIVPSPASTATPARARKRSKKSPSRKRPENRADSRRAGAETDPAYYRQVPEWATRLGPGAGAFATEDERQAYQRRLESMRPLARWMAHVFARLKEDEAFRAPNLLTIEDLLSWAMLVRKFANEDWPLGQTQEKGTTAFKDGIVVHAARMTFLKTLPISLHEGRDLREVAETVISDLARLLPKINLPASVPSLPEPVSPIAARAVEVLNETPRLFAAEEVKGLAGPQYILTRTVQERLEDLLMLYSTNHRKKLFPLIVGPSSEGKSSLVKYMFSLPELRESPAIGGRHVPVVSLAVKETWTRRELFGGKGQTGITLGFFSLAVKHGWVLVLEELNQAGGEFRKSLNDAMHQIRKQGYFEFEVGGQTVRVHAHPHFWVVGTQNEGEGNYAITRNPDTADFLKRWTVRYYDRFPNAETAEILLGLTELWHGKDFAKRHGLTQDFYEKLVTGFHVPVRDLIDASGLGGDLEEPYEFNRRTLHRFLKRFLHDLAAAEKGPKPIDDRARRLLLARELFEAYGAELRSEGERAALWDKINVAFHLKKRWRIERSQVELDVTGFQVSGGRLLVGERLVPISFTVRADGGPRVPGPDKRLTLIPSLARSIYRALRNRQFGEHQFSTGPTGTAKTTEQYFINHMLGEPLFGMTMDDQTPISEFHGGYVKDPATGDFRFMAGILARAMMYDPAGLLAGGLSPAQVRAAARVGATLLINEGNVNPGVLESINPALDDGVLPLSDGEHTAIAGAGFHAVVTYNPVGEGYAGFPLSPALKSRGQVVEHPDDVAEEELAEILLDALSGVTRSELSPPSP